MNRPEQFDDLLRGKLQEREFPFEEAHWADMQRRIAEDKRRKRRPFLFLLFATGLLSGIGAWYALSDTSDTQVAQHAEPTTGSAIAPEVKGTEPMETEPRTVAPTTSTEAPETSTTPGERSTSNTNEGTAVPKAATAPDRQSTAPSVVAAQQPNDPPARDRGQQAQPTPEATIAAATGTMDTAPNEPDNETDLALGASAATAPADPPTDLASPVTTDAPAPEVSVATQKDTLTDTFDDPFADDLFTLSEDLEERYPVKDSAALTQDPNAPPMATSKFVWQISALGGVHRSFNDHGDVPFGTAYTPLNTGLSGAELMRMGTHFGFGSGIHVLSYAEELERQELFKDELSYSTVYTLTPHSLTVPSIIDTVFVGGETYYVTTPMDTTIMVLESDIDTTITRIRTQDAERTRNVLSYVEIPLLLDGHFDTGKWSFGVRGGPTLALLTGRTGAVPQDNSGSLLPAEDAPFNTVSFGYVARLYVRYGLGAHWALGLEPGVRGHFTQALSEAGYSVRPQAYGLHFSLTYRLK